MYPAICRRVERTELLREAFLKTNRVAMLWSLPLGIGLALFARPLLEHALGEQWLPGLTLLQIFAVIAAVNQVGFNWDAFYRALGRTRPIAVANVAVMVAFLAAALPLMIAHGLTGLGIGMAVASAVHLAFRIRYLLALFPRLPIVRHVLGAFLPTVPAAGAVLGLRAAGGIGAIVEALVFVALAAIATWVLEGRLLRELAGYVRRSPASA
jgi:O-antigen/teichoic acid export membrane protein